MKKPNAGDVYYFILRNINRCQNEDHVQKVDELITRARFYNYGFVDSLCDLLQVKRVELITERYPIYE